jgi:hypothetical protein
MLSDPVFVLRNLMLALGVDGFCCVCDKKGPLCH